MSSVLKAQTPIGDPDEPDFDDDDSDEDDFQEEEEDEDPVQVGRDRVFPGSGSVGTLDFRNRTSD